MKRISYLFLLLLFYALGVKALNPYVSSLDSIFLRGGFYEISEMTPVLLKGELGTTSGVDEAVALGYLLMADTSLGKVVDETYKQETLDKIVQALGDKSKIYALVLMQISTYDIKSLTQVEKAIEMLREVCGEDSWEYAYAVHGKSGAYMMMGKVDEALKEVNRAMALFQKNGYDDSWLQARSYSLRACINVQRKDVKAANSDIEKAIDILDTLDEDVIEPGVEIFGHSVYVFSSLGDFGSAIAMGEQLLKIMDTLKLAKTPAYTSTLQNVATAYFFKKDKKKALQLMQIAKSTLESMKMEKDARYAQLLRNMEYMTNN